MKINAVLNIIKTVAILLFPLITFPVVSIALGPENVGKVDFSNSFISYFTLIASLGISAYAIRECSVLRHDREKLSKVASEIFSINIITTVIAYALLALAFVIYKKIGDYRLLILISSTTLLFSTFGCDWINYACEEYLFVTIRTIVLKLIYVVLVVVFVKTPEQTVLYMILNVAVNNIVALSNVFFRGKLCKIRFTFHLNLKTHLKPVMILFAMQISESVLNNLDITMLGFLENDYVVGLYGFAFKIKMMMAQLLYAVIVVFVPKCSLSYAEQNYESFNYYFKRAVQFILNVFLPAIVGLALVAPQVVYIFGGGKFNEAIPYLRILSVSLIIASFGTYLVGNLFLLPAKKEIRYLVASVAGMIANIILNVIMIPMLGGLAAAITTCISEAVIFTCMLWRFDRNVRIDRFAATVIKSAVSIGLMVLFYFLISAVDINYWVKLGIIVVGCAIVYYATLLILRDEFVLENVRFFGKRFSQHFRKGKDK